MWEWILKVVVLNNKPTNLSYNSVPVFSSTDQFSAFQFGVYYVDSPPPVLISVFPDSAANGFLEQKIESNKPAADTRHTS